MDLDNLIKQYKIYRKYTIHYNINFVVVVITLMEITLLAVQLLTVILV